MEVQSCAELCRAARSSAEDMRDVIILRAFLLLLRDMQDGTISTTLGLIVNYASF
jgi:hypothetical protein